MVVLIKVFCGLKMEMKEVEARMRSMRHWESGRRLWRGLVHWQRWGFWERKRSHSWGVVFGFGGCSWL